MPVELLADMPVRQLDIAVESRTDAGISIVANARNIDRVDCYIDGRPLLTASVSDGESKLNIPIDPGPAEMIETRGYASGELVGRRQTRLG